MLNQVEFRKAIPAVNGKYTPGSCHNSRKPRRLTPQLEMRPDSPALGAEQFHVPNQREPHVRSLNLLDGTLQSPREHPHMSRRTLMSPQECEIALCSPKSTQNYDRFPCIGSRAIPCSPSYTTSGLTSFRQLLRFLETHVSSL